MLVRKLFSFAAALGLGVGVLTSTSTALPAEASAATQLTTFCDGVAADVTIPGDLLVRPGRSCRLVNVVIQGNAQVRADADLILDGSTVGGNLVVLANGFAKTLSSHVRGSTRLQESFGYYSVGTTHDGAVNATASTFLVSEESVHVGHVRSSGSETYIASSRLSRDLVTVDDVYTDVEDTVIERNVSITGARSGSLICASEIDGTAAFTGIQGALQIGVSPLGNCGYNVFGSTLTVTDGTAATVIAGNVVRGELVCTGNSTPPAVQDNRVRGGVACDSASDTARRFAAEPPSGERTEALLEKAGERARSAQAAADSAGAAFDG